jgi:phosphomevalonate kinase
MAALTDVAQRGAAAALRGDARALVAAADAYAAHLAELGDASGIDIVSREHRALRALAQASGVTWKSCGAGGGDVGIALALDPSGLARFRARAAGAGFTPLDLALDASGLVARTLRPTSRHANAMEIA